MALSNPYAAPSGMVVEIPQVINVAPQAHQIPLPPYGLIDPNLGNRDVLLRFQTMLRQHMSRCRKAYLYYTVLYHAMLIPVSLLSLSVSIIAFLVTSEVFNSQTNKYLSLTIGILGIVIAAGHSAISYLEFDLKRNNFNTMRDLYSRLHEKIEFTDYSNLSRRDLLKLLHRYLDKLHRQRQYRYPGGT